MCNKRLWFVFFLIIISVAPSKEICEREIPSDKSTTSSLHWIFILDIHCFKSLVTESCLTLCSPADCSPPGSSIHGILQARILECVAIPVSREASQPKDQTCISCFQHWQAGTLPQSHLGSPKVYLEISKTYVNCTGF